jgi:hypothetical protein
MDYMIAELKACQDANGINNADWGKGNLGGVHKHNQSSRVAVSLFAVLPHTKILP